VFYVFVVMDVGTRRIRHWNVTEHPTADWTAQQFRMVMSRAEPHRSLIHDHDSVFSEDVDRTIAAMGLTILKTPVRAPQANAFCERLIGTTRRECLDWLIPLNEDHRDAFSTRGWRITIAGVRNEVLDRAFPTVAAAPVLESHGIPRGLPCRCRASSRRPSPRVLSRASRGVRSVERRRHYLRSTGLSVANSQVEGTPAVARTFVSRGLFLDG
jgi:transposase InsO family protein